MDVLVRIMCSLLYIYFVIRDQTTYAEPTLVSNSPSVIENGTLTMQCITALNASFSTWTRNGVDSAVIGYSQYKCIATNFVLNQPELYDYSCFTNDTFNIYSLTLKAASRDQHGETWQCKARNVNVSNEVTVNVLVPVQTISFERGDSNTLTLLENNRTRVSCTTSYSRPIADVTWYINDRIGSSKRLLLEESDSSYTNSSNTDLVSTISNLHVNFNRTYNQWDLVCEAHNIQDYPAITKSLLLNVTYPTNQPTISCTDNGVYKVVNNTMSNLTCSVDGGNPAGILHWNCTGGVTEYHGPNNNVTQSVVWTATQTQYCTCEATNVAGTRSTSVMAELLYPPVIGELQDMVEFEGDNVTLQCDIRAHPSTSLVIGWSSNKHNTPGATLLISNISRTDDGTYTCTANNTMEPSCKDAVHGSTSRSLHLNILYPPTVHIPHEKSFTVKEGDRFSYTCPVEHGNPPSTNIIWRKSTDTWGSSELLIHSVTRYDDSFYTCYASNVMVNSNGITRNGNRSADVRLIVQFKTNVTYFNIRGNENNTNVTVMEQTSLVFECRLQSNPTSDVLIYEAETLVNKSRANELLYYTRATCAGGPVNYSCLGNNSLSNTPSTRQVELVVNCTPRRDMDVDELVAAGAINETVTLSYTTLAYPLPSFTWYRNGSTIDTTDPRTFVSSTDFQTKLTIDHLIESDFGVYTVIVANNIGFINESFNLKPQGVPEVPTDLRQDDTRTTESKISIYWTSGFNNGLEQTFTVLYRKQPESSEYTWINVSVPDKGRAGTTQLYNISGLSSDTKYDIVLFAVNAKGPSKANASRTCRTNKAGIESTPGTPAALIGAIVGVVVGLVLAGVIIVVVVLFRRKKQQKTSGQSTENPQSSAFVYENVKSGNIPLVKQELSPLVGPSDQGVYENAALGKSKPQMPNGEISIAKGEYVNFSRKRRMENQTANHEELPMRVTLPDRTANGHSKPAPDVPPPIPAKVDFAGLLKVDDDDGHVNNNVNDENVYNNSSFKIERIENVFVHELFDFIAGKSFDSFAAEFDILPKGLTMPYTEAVKPENIKLNRYNGIFPYDHSRVIILDDPDFFVNACYMDGYKKEKSYIASLGPTSDTSKGFKTFWRMVWHEQVDVIVMVTNLRELTGMKCERYWPLLDSTIVYGEVTVTSKNVEEYAEYTVRTFNVSHNNNCRTVTQLHFTAWPDKGVPDDLTSLLEFRQRIQYTPSIKLGPVIVHCSAGIGRTGTYIALDRLIVEGKATNSINVSTCVRSMRKQRVSMVQTQGQYMYIYKACVYALAFECDNILAEKFHDKFKSTTDAQLADLFKKLKTVVDNDKKEEKEAILNNKHEKSNRANADIEGDRHRVRLYVDKESEESDYTNAIYINSFKTKNKFIAAQSPLREFVQDFICTVFQEQCICVIDMDGSTPSKLDVGAYLPTANVSGTFGNFTISCDKLESNPKYTVTKIKIENTGKIYKGDWTSYHFKYHDWKHGKETPGNAHDFVDLWKEVNEYANQFGDKESHILIHCLDGSTRSGLFCFVACLLEKVQCERLVNVGNTLRQVRTRRKTTVKNANQLKFCFKAVDAFIETNKAK